MGCCVNLSGGVLRLPIRGVGSFLSIFLAFPPLRGREEKDSLLFESGVQGGQPFSSPFYEK